MRMKGATVQQWMLGAALLLALCWNITRASEIKQLSVSEGATGTRAELLLDAPGAYTTLSLAGPDRLVVDFPASKLGRRFEAPAGAGVVKSVRTGKPVAGTVRVVFDLALPVVALAPRLESTPDGTRLVLEWPGDGLAAQTVGPTIADPVGGFASVPAAPLTQPALSPNAPAPSSGVAAADVAAKSADATSRLVASLPTTSANTRPQPTSSLASPPDTPST